MVRPKLLFVLHKLKPKIVVYYFASFHLLWPPLSVQLAVVEYVEEEWDYYGKHKLTCIIKKIKLNLILNQFGFRSDNITEIKVGNKVSTNRTFTSSPHWQIATNAFTGHWYTCNTRLYTRPAVHCHTVLNLELFKSAAFGSKVL